MKRNKKKLFAYFAEESTRITFNLNWAFACENNITKSITKFKILVLGNLDLLNEF